MGALLGCEGETSPDSPYRHFQAVAEVTKKWLGIRSAQSGPLHDIASSRVDDHEGRLRRRMDLVVREPMDDEALRGLLRQRLAAKSFTDRIHVGAVLIWRPGERDKPIAVGIYSRDGRGWSGATCDHLRLATPRDETFARLVEELA